MSLTRVRDAAALLIGQPLVRYGSLLGQTRKVVKSRIDEIVAPGTTINPTDAGWTNPALAADARRR